MNCIPNWYTKVADHDFAIRLLKLKMAVKNYIYIYFFFIVLSVIHVTQTSQAPRGIIMLSKKEIADTILRLKI